MKRQGQQTLALLTALLAVVLVPLFQFIAHQVPGFEEYYEHHHTLMDTVLAGLAALCGSTATFVLLRRSNAPLERLETRLADLTSPLSPVGDVRLDQAIRQINTLLELEQQLHQLQEQERIRMARDLHDHVLQDLIGIRMMLARGEHHAAQENLQLALDHLRHRIGHMATPEVTLLGLETALQDRASSLGLTLTTSGLDLVPEKEQLDIYRLTEHALQNAKQHGEASHTSVSYQQGSLTIRDNGKGLQNHVSLGLGLQLCKTQMRLKGGDLKLQDTGKGAELRLWWN